MTVDNLIVRYIDQAKEQNTYEEASQLRRKLILDLHKLKHVEDEIRQSLETLIDDPCKLGASLWLLAAKENYSNVYLKSLLKMLSMPKECVWHEGILDILEIEPNEAMIPHLQDAVNHSLSNDPGKALAIRAMELLIDIDTDSAWEVIEQASRMSTSDTIREEAKEFIKEYRNK